MSRSWLGKTLLTLAMLTTADVAAFGQTPDGLNLGMAYLSDIQAYLLMEAADPKAERRTVLPPNGSVNLFDTSTAAGIGVRIPVGPTIPLGGGALRYRLQAGYQNLHLEPNDGFQLNQPGGRDFEINEMDMHLACFGGEFVYARETSGGGAVIAGVGGNFVYGCAVPDTEVARFDPNKTQVFLRPGVNPNTRDMVAGAEITARVGYVFPNGVSVQVSGGYGGFDTDALTGETDDFRSGRFGVTVEVPLSRLPMVGSLFRNRGYRETERVYYIVQPEIINP